jgi:hypothetical protein
MEGNMTHETHDLKQAVASQFKKKKSTLPIGVGHVGARPQNGLAHLNRAHTYIFFLFFYPAHRLMPVASSFFFKKKDVNKCSSRGSRSLDLDPPLPLMSAASSFRTYETHALCFYFLFKKRQWGLFT